MTKWVPNAASTKTERFEGPIFLGATELSELAALPFLAGNKKGRKGELTTETYTRPVIHETATRSDLAASVLNNAKLPPRAVTGFIVFDRSLPSLTGSGQDL